MPQAETHTEIDIKGSKIDFYVDSFSEWTNILVSNRNAIESNPMTKEERRKKPNHPHFFLDS